MSDTPLTQEQVKKLVMDDAYNTITPERAKAIHDAFDELLAENEWLKAELIAWKHSAISADAQEMEIEKLEAENERLKDLVARHEHSIPIMQASASALIRESQQQLAASEQRGDMLARELASLKAGVGWPHTGAQP